MIALLLGLAAQTLAGSPTLGSGLAAADCRIVDFFVRHLLH